MAIMSHYCDMDYYDYQVKNGCGYSCEVAVEGNEIVFNEIVPISLRIYLRRTNICVYHIFAFIAGFVLDLLIGDPHFIPHPVRLIGSPHFFSR